MLVILLFFLLTSIMFYSVALVMQMYYIWWFYWPIISLISIFVIYGIRGGLIMESKKIIKSNPSYFESKELSRYFVANAGIFLGKYEFPGACKLMMFMTSLLWTGLIINVLYAIYSLQLLPAGISFFVGVVLWRANLDSSFYSGRDKWDVKRSMTNYISYLKNNKIYTPDDVDWSGMKYVAYYEQLKGRLYLFYTNPDKFLMRT